MMGAGAGGGRTGIILASGAGGGTGGAAGSGKGICGGIYLEKDPPLGLGYGAGSGSLGFAIENEPPRGHYLMAGGYAGG